MARFLIDEDMNSSIAGVLKKLGHEALDVWDEGLQGEPDDSVFRYAQDHEAVLLTADMGFSDITRFPLGTHAGIVVARFPNELSTPKINAEITKCLKGIVDEEFTGSLVIVSPGRVRIKRKE